VCIGIIDRIHRELENRFDEVSRELLICMAALNPSNSFAWFDAKKSNKVRNSMSDRLLNDCLVTFIEHDIFSSVSEDDIIHAFMAMRKSKLK